MLLVVSIVIISLYTAYYLRKIYANGRFLSHVMGKVLTMALTMVNSLTVGFLLASFLHGKLAVSTILSVTLSGCIAYLLGKPFGLLSIIDGLVASLMGGMMGAMLAEMLQSPSIALVTVYMDVVYILSFSLAVVLINREIAKKGSKIISKFYSICLAIIVPLMIIGVAVFFDFENVGSKSGLNGHNLHHMMKE